MMTITINDYRCQLQSIGRTHQSFMLLMPVTCYVYLTQRYTYVVVKKMYLNFKESWSSLDS